MLRVTLNRPDRMNVLTVDTRKRILEVLRAHESDAGVSCVLFASQGKVFSAGADLNHLLTLEGKRAEAYSVFVRSFLDYVEGYPKPTVGLVGGVAVGGGLELLLTLDIIIASPEARFGQTELNVGLIPGGGGSQRLPRAVGARKAKEMIYTGDLISAREALELGLVNRVVSARALQAEAARICERIKSKDRGNLRLVKEAINAGLSMSLKDGLEFETKLYSNVLRSRETKRRIEAFLHGRGQSRAER